MGAAVSASSGSAVGGPLGAAISGGGAAIEHVVDQVGRRRELGRLRLVAGRHQRRLAGLGPGCGSPDEMGQGLRIARDLLSKPFQEL